MVMFDARVCEGADKLNCTILTPTWTCKIPSNLNDFELRLDMQKLPTSQETITENLYVVLRTALAHFSRYDRVQVDFIDPSLQALVNNLKAPLSLESVDEVDALERRLRKQYLDRCDLSDRLHFMSFWTAQSQLAKMRLMRYYWTAARSQSRQTTEKQRDEASLSAIQILKAEIQLVCSPLTQCFRWHISHFQFQAYVHLVQDLKLRPLQSLADEAWETLDYDFKARFENVTIDGEPIFRLLAKAVLDAWKAREMASRDSERIIREPWIITEMQRLLRVGADTNELESGAFEFNIDDFIAYPLNFDDFDHA